MGKINHRISIAKQNTGQTMYKILAPKHTQILPLTHNHDKTHLWKKEQGHEK